MPVLLLSTSRVAPWSDIKNLRKTTLPRFTKRAKCGPTHVQNKIHLNQCRLKPFFFRCAHYVITSNSTFKIRQNNYYNVQAHNDFTCIVCSYGNSLFGNFVFSSESLHINTTFVHFIRPTSSLLLLAHDSVSTLITPVPLLLLSWPDPHPYTQTQRTSW